MKPEFVQKLAIGSVIVVMAIGQLLETSLVRTLITIINQIPFIPL